MRKLLTSFLGENQQHEDGPSFRLTSALLELSTVLRTYYDYDNCSNIEFLIFSQKFYFA